MAVGELQNKLAKFPDNSHVVVYRELERDQECFGIDSVELHTVNPSRDSHGKARFSVDRGGAATWCFIEISLE
jgi:hypothetical protein